MRVVSLPNLLTRKTQLVMRWCLIAVLSALNAAQTAELKLTATAGVDPELLSQSSGYHLFH